MTSVRQPAHPPLEVSERYWASKTRLLQLLTDLQAAGQCDHTVYLRPESILARSTRRRIAPSSSREATVASVIDRVKESETGLVVFLGSEGIRAVAPPFPVLEDMRADGAHVTPLVELLNRDLLVGVVLLRLGRYAVGVLRGAGLVASKTGGRYVKSRHRAGGSSQRRFERSRERLVRELFDKACQVAAEVFTPYGDGIDYLLAGGERHTLRAFLQRCRYLQGFERKTLKRVLQVDRPGQEALEGIASEVWKSRVVTLVPESGPCH